MSRISFAEIAWEDYLYWQGQDKKTLRKINALLKDVLRHPFSGLGQPEPLKNDARAWSRRINAKDRLVYVPTEETILVLQCKGHYDDK